MSTYTISGITYIYLSTYTSVYSHLYEWVYFLKYRMCYCNITETHISMSCI